MLGNLCLDIITEKNMDVIEILEIGKSHREPNLVNKLVKTLQYSLLIMRASGKKS